VSQAPSRSTSFTLAMRRSVGKKPLSSMISRLSLETNGRQRLLARPSLQADEQQCQQAQHPAGDPGEEATPAHQKACPMLT